MSVDQPRTACVLVAPDGSIAWSNPQARVLLGEALAGRRCGEVLAPIEAIRNAAVSEASLTSTRRERELGFQVSPLDVGFLVLIQDLTDLERLRAERDRLMQLAAVGEVLPALLHELKNPLAAVRTAVEVLVEESSGEVAEQLLAVLNEIRRIGLVLDGVGRVKRELGSDRPAPIDQAVREAFAVLSPQGIGRGIRMEAEVEELPRLGFDPSAMRAIVFNLVTNAIQACRSGDGIRLRLSRSGSQLLLEINDTGVGMTPQVRERCTELFFTTKPRGSGIGLALVHDLVASVTGRLDVESTPGVGTTISIRLPLED